MSSSGTVEVFNSVQVASGSFTLSIDPSNFTGTGSGQGTITVTTTGFCSGQTTLSYAFTVPNANDLLRGNITIAFSDNIPSNVTVKLTCSGDMTNVNTVNNPISFMPVYPNLVSENAVPASVIQRLSGGISYGYTITATN